MKELSIEEKAKAYDEAIERAKEYWDVDIDNTMNVCAKGTMEYLFPELKESEDERIRKALISVFSNREKYLIDQSFGDITVSEALTWLEKQGKIVEYYEDKLDRCACENFNKGYKKALEKQGEHDNFINKIQIGDKVTRNEDGVLVNLSQLNRVAKKDEKQGETFTKKDVDDAYLKGICDAKHELEKQGAQKPVDKVESKFKVGDWIIYDGWTTQIKEVYEDGYSNIHRGFIPKDREDSMRLWTIQDAKDGDIIIDPATQYEKESIFIFERIDENNVVRCYVTLSNMQTLHISNDICNVCGYADKILYTPASKEQRDLLFQKMKEAGYEWDAENKQLRKIESRQEELTDFEKAVKRIMEEAIECGDTHNFKADADMLLRLAQKHAEWSEEDEDILNTIINHFKVDIECTDEDDTVRWLKSLKERVQPQPKQEWSEDDIKEFKAELQSLMFEWSNKKDNMGVCIDRHIDKLLSILCNHIQSQWKPSDEQMEALEWSLHNWTGKTKEILELLQSDLKKLREDKL